MRDQYIKAITPTRGIETMSQSQRWRQKAQEWLYYILTTDRKHFGGFIFLSNLLFNPLPSPLNTRNMPKAKYETPTWWVNDGEYNQRLQRQRTCILPQTVTITSSMTCRMRNGYSYPLILWFCIHWNTISRPTRPHFVHARCDWFLTLPPQRPTYDLA